ncbi:MAG: DUF1902 domain-containing protein [Thiohalomonadales bacterium]
MQINVNASWDPEASVWVAESNEVPGLIAEAENLDLLSHKLQCLIPELLELNGMEPAREIPFYLHSQGLALRNKGC